MRACHTLPSYSETLSHTICGVCSKPYNDPRILPCLHSFCQQCLNHEMETKGSQELFKCPTCERNMSIPVGGASSLSQNLHLGFAVEVAGYMAKIVSKSEVYCDQCVYRSSGPAVVFCSSCHTFLCTSCHEYHKRHNTVGLDKEGAKQLLTTMKPRDHHCSQPNHWGNKVKSYCVTCKLLVCKDCIAVAHKDHSVTEISTVAKTHLSTVEEMLTKAKGIAIKLPEAIDGNDKMMEQVETSKRNALLAINHEFEILQQTLEERKKKLLSEVEAIALSKKTALILQKELFKNVAEDIGHYTEMTSHILQTHTYYEVVALGGFIHTELKATLKKLDDMKVTTDKHIDISVHIPTDNLIADLSKFGYIVEFTPTSSMWTSTFPSVAKVGSKFQVAIKSNTKNGNQYPHGSVQVKAELRPKSHDGAVVPGEVEDHGDGTYTITLTPQTAGPHQLVITMDGQHVQNSPRDLDVRSKPNYLTLCNPQQVINCSGGPLCIAIHDNGNMYVGSSENCIYVFDPTGNPKNTITKVGKYALSSPRGIFIDEDILYVADYGNNCIQKMTSDGKLINTVKADSPAAVIVGQNKRIIVSNYIHSKICILNHNGSPLFSINGDVIGNQCFLYPWGLALDPQGNIHVAATGSSTIKVFTMEGIYMRAYGDVSGPYGIAIDDEGCSVVSENCNDCLSIFDPEGKIIHTVMGLNNPHGVVLNCTNGSVFVANHNTKTILKYCI